MKNTLILAALCTCGISQANASFVGLGDFNGGIFENRCWNLSANGQWVVGGGVGIAGPTAYRWSTQTGLLPLGDLAGGAWDSEAKAVSADGSVICGQGTTAGGTRGWRWTSGTGLVELADLPGGSAWTWPTAISDDGTVIVGNADDASGQVSCRWQNGQVFSLGNLDYNSNWAQGATAVSGNGSLIAGYSGIANTGLAFRWTSGAGMLPISSQQGFRAVDASDITPDGSTIVGWGSQGDGYVHPYRWTQASFEWLPGVAVAKRVSADGRFVAGQWYPTPQNITDEASFFDPMFGWRRLRTVLMDSGATGFANWELVSIQGMTVINDEVIVCGNGLNPDGNEEAFFAKFPVPHQFIGGQCVLEDVVSMEGQAIWVEVRAEGTTQVLGTYLAVVDAVGRFRVEVEHMAGPYLISIKSAHHLRRTLGSVQLTGDGASVQVSLQNGDVDGDNEVGIADYARISSSWGLEKGETGFDDDADLNIDTVVDIADYAILSANYGLMGDE